MDKRRRTRFGKNAKFDRARQIRFLDALCSDGSLSGAARLVGTSVGAVAYWRRRDPVFDDAVKIAVEYYWIVRKLGARPL